MQKKYLHSAVVAALLSTTSVTAFADTDAIERITVAGEYRTKTLNEVPASVTALSQEDSSQRAAVHLETMFNAIPNVNFSGGSSRARFMQIRGIGERSQFVDPISPSVGIFVDRINYSGLGQVANLFDAGQVEVFRGPQSGRFGADALAGMIYISSTEPSNDFRGKWQAQVANYGEVAAGLAIGGGLGALGDARLSVNQLNNDGFTENAFLNRDDTEKRAELSARFNLHTDFGNDWSLRTTLHAHDMNNGYDAFSLENDRTTLSDQPGEDDLQSQAARLELRYSGLASSEIQVSVSGMTADTQYSFDEDWTYVGIAPGWEYSSFDAYERERDDRTMELRWLSTEPASLFGNDTDWVFGVYDYRRDVSLTRDYFNWDLGEQTVFSSDYESHRQAVYGELVPYFSEQTWLTLGLRVENYDNTYLDSNRVQQNPSDTMWGGRLSLSHAVRDNSVIYTSVTRGYKVGGVNGEALGKAQDQGLAELEEFLLQQATFEPELLTSAEFGVKGSNLDNSLAVRMSLFYNWRDDVQLKSWVNRDQSFVGYLKNADSGDSYGMEVELDYQPNEQWRWFANVGLLRTEIQGFVTEDGMDMSGRDQAHAPEYMANVGVEYWPHEQWQFSVQADAKDGFYYSNSHNSQSNDYALLHAQLNFFTGPWQFSLWARNLTDEDYGIRGFYFGNDPRDEYVPETYVQYGEPRRFGIRVSYEF
ncbi:Outer membrane receptor proteins, mostly Fe transport [Pseudidiomarina planktonica]|uniref:Outer membrane receptor proteins, mostly Fe transport n=1 Tax=Pseudidiomarina planktonica TaxID=1323738 RepID=A0A1Y6FW85_9GAMM|nr:TonB-dependent receptor plug domain-containing protein [Pseudidiomarina planktonica]RUO63883.1 hypothetical protein CWI77_09175 [Pseudidiomarina planktonica]SMQ80043.1 Outer membrane receptor proteins, mostly Fe transport [Pseudidiomarina planktonica]